VCNEHHISDHCHNISNSRNPLQIFLGGGNISEISKILTATSYSYDWLRAAQCGDRIPVEARFFAQVQSGLGAHLGSCIMGTGSFPGVKRPGRGADYPPPPSTEIEKE
jgi:hypothetical protein